MIRAALLAAALLLAGPAWAAEPKTLPIPAEEQSRVDGALAIGRLIYDYDQVAWVTTDVLTERVPADQMPREDGGWVIEPRADGALVVSYYGVWDGQASVFFVATAKDGKVIEARAIPKAERTGLTPIQARMVAAKKAAQTRVGGKEGWPLCVSKPFNTVTLAPRSPEDPVTVYYLTPQIERGVYPFGGHYRFDVDKDGKVVFDRAFTKACFPMGMRQAPKGADGRPAAAVVTHLLDPTPTEIHVYLSLWMKLPVFVAINGRLWAVSGTQIELFDPKSIGQ